MITGICIYGRHFFNSSLQTRNLMSNQILSLQINWLSLAKSVWAVTYTDAIFAEWVRSPINEWVRSPINECQII